MHRRSVIALVALALLLWSCGDDDAGDPTAPGDIPTATESPTAAPVSPTETASPPPTASPSPGETAAGELPASDVCSGLEGGEELAFVFVERPLPGAEVAPGFPVAGCANAFEATFEWKLLDADGAELAGGFGTASCGSGCVGTFEFTVDYVVGELQVGSLQVFTSSPRDGSPRDLNVIPLRLTP